MNQTNRQQELLAKALKRLQAEVDYDNANRQEAIDDLRFESGINQWDEQEARRKKELGQAALQVNVLPKYVKQVTGEMRQNKIKIKVRPVDSDGDIEIANIREGMIYNIEYKSNAENIYDYAANMAVKCGYGAWRVLAKYSDDNVFEQEIVLESIDNPFSVYIDTDAKDMCYADAKYGFIIDRIPKEKFEELYPDAATGGGGAYDIASVSLGFEKSLSTDYVPVVEYFYTEEKYVDYVKLSDGRVMKKKEALEEIEKLKENDLVDNAAIPEIEKERKDVCEKKIKWAKLTNWEVLEERDWPGNYIPIVMMHGEVTNIEGQRYIQGLVRNAKDSQRLLNYWHTAAAETISMSPKAPWMASAKMIQGYEKDYLNAHTINFPLLKYNPDPNFPGQKPERTPMNQVPAALFAEISRAEQNIKSTIGMFNADVGDQGRELSGAAIQARQLPGDTATYLYPDNLAKAVMHSGKIINDLIPKIYVEERDARLRNIDDSESFAPINTTLGRALESIQKNPQRFAGMNQDRLKKEVNEKGEYESFNDISVGGYDVVIDVGPAYKTQRQESADALTKIGMASAQMNPLDKYFIVKNLDFLGADEYADAVRKTVPPGILPPAPGEEPPKPPPPTPQQVHDMQMEQVKLQTELLNRQVQVEKMRVEAERRRTEQAQQQVELLRLYNEAKEGDFKDREQILRLLDMQYKQMESDQKAAEQQLQQGQQVQ